jgi:hypothetical protein
MSRKFLTITTILLTASSLVFYGFSPFLVETVKATTGEETFTSSQSWQVPSGVQSIDVVVVGGGGGAAYCAGTSDCSGAGGGGGGLGYRNSISVTPGETLSVTVGQGGAGGDTSGESGASGGDTYLERGTATLVKANGGGGAPYYSTTCGAGGAGGAGGTSAFSGNDGGGDGGDGGASAWNTGGGGGGGAGGYSGNGGDAGSGNGGVGSAGVGGAGGGGGGQSNSGIPNNGGGGVGIPTEGANGSGGADSNPGTGGSGGGTGTSGGHGGSYGAGGGGREDDSAGAGGDGAPGVLYVYYEITVPVPTVTTDSATIVEATGVDFVGNITNGGGSSVTRRGFAYMEGTTGDPTTLDSVIYEDDSTGFSTGSYSLSVSGLSQNTDYRVRAYAVNSDGTGYGETLQFSTLSEWYKVLNNTEVVINECEKCPSDPDCEKEVSNPLGSPDIFVPTKTCSEWAQFRINRPVHVSVSDPAPSFVLTDGLISLWELDETSGTTAYDNHASRDMIPVGSPTINQTGISGKSYSFDGNDDGLKYDVYSDLALSPEASHSYCLWFKRNGNSINDGAGSLFSRYYSSTGYRVYITFLSDTDNASSPNRLRVGYYDSNNVLTEVAYDPPSDIFTGNWAHMCSVRDGDHIELYLNGNSVGENTGGNGLMRQQTHSYSLGLRDMIGAISRSSTNPDVFFNGQIDQVASWNRALISDEVSAIYNSGNGLPYSEW